MTAEQIKETLKEGTFQFQYTKKDGSVRTATGTRNPGLLKHYEATPNGNGSEKDGVITYYDIDAKGWRSFITENFIKFL